ncbi:radical SAM superfamily protein (plasmid) [Burkholderia thailandensis 34]|uniref:radical SAM protein n=1 Tax=Burkholderia thailandensis TaxID=57975 RepID=UPI0007065099|nr:radical SAM protein [Burkholderia thailandensis]AJY27213.1 radical SAM superfamily protein [Burkholderia thailandensis 34]
MPYLQSDEIAAHGIERWPRSPIDAFDRARTTLHDLGLAGDSQQMGQRWPVGCIALEITQRCNLDCTLCYLSENAEAVKDIPLEELFSRIDTIFASYGPNADVQVTGGEPTLRDRGELLAIVRRIWARGMRATLMTNGIRVTRMLLEQLTDAGLADVAFHVDTTQQRRGYATEAALNALRERYLNMAAGLPLSVMFNTTVHDGNFDEIPSVVSFFRSCAGRIRTVSFQLQADIGRGVQRARGLAITPDTVVAQIEKGAGTPITFSASLIGHPCCNRYGMCIAANGNLHDAFDDPSFVAAMQSATAALAFDRTYPAATAHRLIAWFARHPALWPRALSWTARKGWAMRKDILASGARVHTLSFIIHNFMDAARLEEDRIRACAFKVATSEGPVSMCLHNARRDAFVLKPIRIYRAGLPVYWNPATGKEAVEFNGLFKPGQAVVVPRRRRKGRSNEHVVKKVYATT